MKLVEMIIKKIKPRGVIVDTSKEPVRDNNHEALKAAKHLCYQLQNELTMIKKISDLLEAPIVVKDNNKHLTLTMPTIQWMNDGKPLTILFSLTTATPVCAYFDEELPGDK